jgi:FMN reductase
MNILVISSSLSSQSRSRQMAEYALEQLQAAGARVEFVDLREFTLPLCDGEDTYAHPAVKRLAAMVESAQGILVATPIYNYDVNAALKNMVELTGRYWTDKVVGFMCSAGGKTSYMSILSLANSLMLDFRSIIIPRFVYINGSRLVETNLEDDIKERIDKLDQELIRFVKGLKSGA